MTYRPGTYRNHAEEIAALLADEARTAAPARRTFAEAIVDAPERDNDQWLRDLEDTGRGLAVIALVVFGVVFFAVAAAVWLMGGV